MVTDALRVLWMVIAMLICAEPSFAVAVVNDVLAESLMPAVVSGSSTPAAGEKGAPAAEADFDLNRYLATLNRQCTADSDCEVKDVGNCCGYYPQCVAKNATPQKEAVRAWCERNEVKGICGFQEIKGCACVAGRCTAAAVQ